MDLKKSNIVFYYELDLAIIVVSYFSSELNLGVDLTGFTLMRYKKPTPDMNTQITVSDWPNFQKI